MELLTAINRILPALGEHPVTRVDTKHPTLAIIVPIIQAKLDETLLRGWWFNEFPYTLYQNNEGIIDMPAAALSFIARDVDAIVRGRQLYNPTTMNFLWTAPVVGTLTQRILFDELPESVATYVFYSALIQTYLTDIGLESVVQKWEAVKQEAEATATQEHLRNKKYSTRRSARYIRLRNAMRG